MSNPWAVMSTGPPESTSSIQAGSSAEPAISRRRSEAGKSSWRSATASGTSTVTHRTRPSSTRQNCVSSPSPSATTVPPGAPRSKRRISSSKQRARSACHWPNAEPKRSANG